MKYLLATFSLIVLLSNSCTSTRKIVEEARPPLLQKQATPSEEIQYMFETDQEDRGAEGGFLTVAGRTAKIVRDPEFRNFMIERDSLRLTRTWQLFRQGQITSIEDKYLAAFIFTHHSYNVKEPPDSIAYYQAYLWFSESAAHHPDKEIRKEADFFGKEAYDRFKKAIGNRERKNSFSVKLDSEL